MVLHISCCPEYKTTLTDNLCKVESFQHSEYVRIKRNLDAVHCHYGITASTIFEGVDGPELEDLMISFHEIRDALKQLKWFSFVNFKKILPRLIKFHKSPQTNDPKISRSCHVVQDGCITDLSHVNGVIARLQSPRLRVSSGLKASFPQLRHLEALETDDIGAVNGILAVCSKDQSSDNPHPEQAFFAFLYLAILKGSSGIVRTLLGYIKSLNDVGDTLHWLVIRLGQRKNPRDRPPFQGAPRPDVSAMFLTRALDQLCFVIRWLGSTTRHVFYKIDSFGRLAPHHAVRYGLFIICEELLRHMKESVVDGFHDSISAVLLPDSEGLSALDISVRTGNAPITELLIKHHQSINSATGKGAPAQRFLGTNLLTTALKLNCFAIVQLLHKFTSDASCNHWHNETPLYIAVRSGRLEHISLLLEGPQYNEKKDLTTPEDIFGWTSLILASVKGNLPAVDLLLQAGADPNGQDFFGWTSKDHAAYRGHLPLARTLAASESIIFGSKTQID